MSILAVIPARGGSKGVPRKNILTLAGRPLIAHMIDAARASPSLTRIVVSTDDPEIRDVAIAHGAEVIMRPVDISGDNAPSEEALLHVLRELDRTEGYQPELVVFLQCTAPLTTAEDIEGTIKTFIQNDADSAFSGVPFHHFIWTASNGSITGVNHEPSIRQMRQGRQPEVLESGAVYVMRVSGFLEAQHRFFGKTVTHMTPAEHWLEIDSIEDFRRAEAILGARTSIALPATIRAIVFDFDGVFTDNHVFVFQDGREAVRCNRSDGLGLSLLREVGIPTIVLSTETNPVVQMRCQKVGIALKQGLVDKLSALREWAVEQSMSLNEIAYVGNDVNDLSCLRAVGCGIVVHDAHPTAKAAARIVLASRGGYGAVREVVDLFLSIGTQT